MKNWEANLGTLRQPTNEQQNGVITKPRLEKTEWVGETQWKLELSAYTNGWVGDVTARGTTESRIKSTMASLFLCPPPSYLLIGWTQQEGCWFSSVQPLSHVQLFVNPLTAARQASLSITNSRSLLKPYPWSRWCHPTVSSSVIPFSSCLPSVPALGSFPMSQFFTSR